MRGWRLGAFPLGMSFPTRPCGGQRHPDPFDTVHTFDAQVCEHLPPEGF
jgi:hypothetical protein